MKRPELLRRVVLLSCHCLRNVALYRSAWCGSQLIVTRQFWINANANALDIAVLEWCKLFADREGKHHWTRVVVNKTEFRIKLLDVLGMSELEFRQLVRTVLRYRNKFVAHLDEETTMHIPELRALRRSSAFLYDWLRADAKDAIYLQYAPHSSKSFYNFIYRHGRDEHRKGAA